jgi:hypothetical protein
MKRRFALLVAALAVATPVVMLLGSTPPAGATFEFTFVEHPTNFEFTVNGQHTLQPTGAFAPGDSLVIRADLVQGGATVGFDNVNCVVTFNDNLLCDAVFAFNGKGDITGTALLRGGVATEQGPAVFDGAITGGTFAYRNAHGDAHAVNQPNGDTNWTFNFVTQ